MDKKKKQKMIDVLKMVSDDVENDAKEFDGKPFTGKTMAEYMGNHGAAINAIAGILKETLEDTKP